MIKSSRPPFHTTSHTDDPYPLNQELTLTIGNGYTREELFGLVWQSPMTDLASSFGTSTTTIKLTCTKYNIPVPPRGFWSKVRAGKPVRWNLLPQRPPGMPNCISLGARKPSSASQPTKTRPYDSASIEDLRREVSDGIGAVSLKDQATTPGTVVSSLKNLQPQTSVNQNRKLTILRVLFDAASQFGGKATQFDPNQPDFVVTFHAQNVRFSLQAQEACLTTKSLNYPSLSSDILVLNLQSGLGTKGLWKTWRDYPNDPLENYLSEVAIELVMLAELQQRDVEFRRSEWMAEQRQEQLERDAAAEFAQQRYKDHQTTQKLDTLLRHSKELEQATSLRRMVRAVDEAFQDRGDVSIQEWRAFALESAAKLDPLSNGRFLSDLDFESQDGSTHSQILNDTSQRAA